MLISLIIVEVPDAVDFFRNIGCRVRVGEATRIIETFANKKARKAAVGTPVNCTVCLMFMFFFLKIYFVHNTNGKQHSMNIYSIIH